MTTTPADVDALSLPVVAFLRDALAPSRSRWLNSLRLTLLCAVATTIVMALHFPDGEFLIIFFFAVSQPDAWASLRKARLRGLGTLVGGALAVLGVLTFGDRAWMWLVAQAFLFAATLFLSRTTTIPYAIILAMFTFVIATPVVMTNPEASLYTVFWRILLTMVGAILGTIAQLVLWPESPPKLLLQELASRLQKVEMILARLTSGGARPATAEPAVSTGTINQLDLLASAESGSIWVRQHHADFLKLIMDVETILIEALRLDLSAPLAQDSEELRTSLIPIRGEVGRFRRAITGHPVKSIGLVTETPASSIALVRDPAAPLPMLSGLENAMQQTQASKTFLAVVTGEPWRKRTEDRLGNKGSFGTILTPACTLSNVEAVQFGLKGALAASICYVLYQALNWPGISTCVVTTLIVAQSSFGAGLQKSILRLLGAVLGGLMAAIVIMALVPNMVSLASFIIVVSGLFFVAAWMTTGNSRVSYVGLQIGLVLALVLLNQPGPTTNLTPAMDRVIGVLIGITVMGFIDLTLWPNFAGAALRRKLTHTHLALAEFLRCASRQDWVKTEETALLVRRRLALAFGLYGEAGLEFGSPLNQPMDRRRFLAITLRLEETFIALLVFMRHRRAFDQAALPEDWRQRLGAFDTAVAEELELLAAAPQGPGTRRTTEVGLALSELAIQSQAASRIVSATGRMRLTGLVVLGNEVVEALSRLEEEVGLPNSVGAPITAMAGSSQASTS